MNDVPLIQTPDTNSINTSIIAIKKQLRTINEALGLIDIPDAPDLSPYVKKSDVVDTVESGNMNPVTSNAVNNYKTDTVASGNNLPVTSNAVAVAFGSWETVWRDPTYPNDSYILGLNTQVGKFLRIRFSGVINGNSGYIENGRVIVILPSGWRPVINSPNRCIIGVDTPSIRMNAGLDIESSGNIKIYFQGNTAKSGGETVSGLFCDVFMNLR